MSGARRRAARARRVGAHRIDALVRGDEHLLALLAQAQNARRLRSHRSLVPLSRPADGRRNVALAPRACLLIAPRELLAVGGLRGHEHALRDDELPLLHRAPLALRHPVEVGGGELVAVERLLIV